MIQVCFDTAYQNYTNGLPLVELEGPLTFKELLVAVFSRFPQLYVRLQEDLGLSERTLVILNDELILDYSDKNLHVGSGDCLVFAEVPNGRAEAAAVGLAIVLSEAGIIATGAAADIFIGIMTAVLTTVIVAGINMAISAIMGALTSDIAPPDAGMGISNSSTYTFDGVKNTTYSGAPLFITYGEHRVGGNVLNVYVDNTYTNAAGTVTVSQDTTDSSANSVLSSELYTQIGLCEGEVESVSDIWINKLPLNFYNGAGTPEVRMGLPTQEVMLDYSRVENTVTANRKVLCLYDSSSARIDFSSASRDSLFSYTLGTATPCYGVLESTTGGYRHLQGAYKL